jgi:outer membrane autotransporter protein
VALTGGHNFTREGFVFGPTARLTHSSMTINGYTESDAIHASAALPRQTATSTILGLSGQVSHPMQFGAWRVTPQARAGWDIVKPLLDKHSTLARQ